MSPYQWANGLTMHSTMFIRDLSASADRVWALLDDFSRLDWFLLEHELEVVGNGSPGTVRIIKMADSDPCWEVLLAKDLANLTLSYAVPVGLQLPVSSYSATMRVEPLGEGRARLHWYGTWIPEVGHDPEDIRSEFTKIYNLLADGIETVLRRDD